MTNGKTLLVLAALALAGCATDPEVQDNARAARDVEGPAVCPPGQQKICEKTTDRLACSCTRMMTRPTGGSTPHR